MTTFLSGPNQVKVLKQSQAIKPPAPNSQENNSRAELQQLAERLNTSRMNKGLSLNKAARLAGIAPSTLFKIEKGTMSPTFSIISKLSSTLEISVGELFESKEVPEARKAPSLVKAHAGIRYSYKNFKQEILSSDFPHASMFACRMTVLARKMTDFSPSDRHDSQDFMIVLSGTLVFHSEGNDPIVMEPGDSLYYDGSIPHMCISTSEEDAELIWVSSNKNAVEGRHA